MAGYIGSKSSVVSSGAERKKVFTATSGQTSFTGLSYTVNNVHVFQNGVRLVDGTDYTATNGNSITLTVGALADDQVVVVSYNTFQTSDTVSASAGGTFAGDVNFSGNAHINGTTSITTAVTGDNVAPKLIVEGTTATSIAVLRQDTSIVSGNSLGSLGFYGTDTTSNTPTPLAAVQALASGTHAAGDNPTDLRFLTTPDNSATITEAMRISGGNLLVGQSSTALPGAGNTTTGISVSGQYDALFISRSSGSSGVFNRNSDGDIVQFRKDGATVGGIGSVVGQPYFISGSRGIRIAGNNIRPTATAGANLDNVISLGDTGQRFKDLYLSGGVYLGGTGSANKLSDYETGTWTPTLLGVGADPTVTYATTNTGGVYVKVGRVVHISYEVRTSSISGGSGAVRIGGLPFARAATQQPDGDRFTVDLYNVTFPSGTNYVVNTAPRSSSFFTLLAIRNATTHTDVQISSWPTSALGIARATGWYYTDS